jgi:hypothetical protein
MEMRATDSVDGAPAGVVHRRADDEYRAPTEPPAAPAHPFCGSSPASTSTTCRRVALPVLRRCRRAPASSADRRCLSQPKSTSAVARRVRRPRPGSTVIRGYPPRSPMIRAQRSAPHRHLLRRAGRVAQLCGGAHFGDCVSPPERFHLHPRCVPRCTCQQRNIVVEPRPDGRWARQKNGTRRAASLHDTQTAAETAARAQAKRERAELVVKGRDGKLQRRDSYGNDPRSTKG